MIQRFLFAGPTCTRRSIAWWTNSSCSSTGTVLFLKSLLLPRRYGVRFWFCMVSVIDAIALSQSIFFFFLWSSFLLSLTVSNIVRVQIIVVVLTNARRANLLLLIMIPPSCSLCALEQRWLLLWVHFGSLLMLLVFRNVMLLSFVFLPDNCLVDTIKITVDLVPLGVTVRCVVVARLNVSCFLMASLGGWTKPAWKLIHPWTNTKYWTQQKQHWGFVKSPLTR